jgi:hypothetical protein
MKVDWLADPKQKAGVFHLQADAREFGNAAAEAGFKVYRLDIGHAHDKDDFIGHVSKAMAFPGTFGGNWDAFADCLKDLSWAGGAKGEAAKGWVVILEKSKHFCAGHHHEFEEAMDIMDEAATFWRNQGKALWTLIGGPEGWKSGWPDMPAV